MLISTVVAEAADFDVAAITKIATAAFATGIVVATMPTDAHTLTLRLEVDDAELAMRRKAWRAPAPRYTRGVLAKYAAHVTSASLGAVTDADLKL